MLTINIPDHSIERVGYGDENFLINLYLNCSDYIKLLSGEEVTAKTVEEDLTSLPPARSMADKEMYVLKNQTGEAVAFLEGVKNHPDDKTCWIGLLLVDPKIRRQGVGRKIVEAFQIFAAGEGYEKIVIAVLEKNESAINFWTALGFQFVRQTEPKKFGTEEHILNILEKKLTNN